MIPPSGLRQVDAEDRVDVAANHKRGGTLIHGDNLPLMSSLPDESCDLIYLDPPFNTGKTRGSRSGACYSDRWPGGARTYLDFLLPRLEQCHRLLSRQGSLYVHLDWRSVHHVRIELDRIFDADNLLNEIVWSYRTGGRPTRSFARKHDSILLYAKSAGDHVFHLQRGGDYRTEGLNRDSRGRPYKNTRNGRLYFHPDGPALTDVWDIPFLSTVSSERTGYPSQKPEALLERIVRASSDPGDLVADFFCGSGTTCAVAARLERRWLGCDSSADAVAIAAQRLSVQPEVYRSPAK
ncbi:MAG: site-specific DNA-methyltransferase [bacterium]|nr:site-specific DNA-methyltransferase [bacterium]